MNLSEEKIRRIALCLKGNKPIPFKAVLIPTNRCNLKCLFCPNALPRVKGKFKIEQELKDDEWKKIVNEGLELGIKEWSIIGGGEPLMRYEAVISIIKMIKSWSNLTECELITNGTLLKKNDILNLVKLKMDRILFSIDAPDIETHDYLRGVEGAFKKVSKNLKLFLKFKKKLQSDKPYIKINLVLNKKNYKKIVQMIRFVKKNGGQEIALHPMREYWEKGININHLKMNKMEEVEMMKEIFRAKKISKGLDLYLNTDMIELKSYEKDVRTKKNTKKIKATCFEPLYSILIDPEGNVGKCGPSGSGFEDLNLRKNSLKEIWYHQKLEEIRKMIMDGKIFDSCQKCGLIDMKIHIENELFNSGLYKEYSNPNKNVDCYGP